jgi:hypothetical protein
VYGAVLIVVVLALPLGVGGTLKGWYLGLRLRRRPPVAREPIGALRSSESLP